MTPSAPADARSVGLSEMLAALSHALDLTEGQPAGHTLRACRIGMRLADEMGLPLQAREALYYALLLKDAGCSSNASRMAALFGSPDQEVKYRMKLVDWNRRAPLALQTLRNAGRGRSLRARARHFLRIARTPDVTRDLIAIRCERGADIVRRLGFPEAAAEAVHALDEHWDGRGHPEGKAGEEIPLLARIALLAQALEIFFASRSAGAALGMARSRRGSWFDPALVDRVLAWRSDRGWWESLRAPDLAARVVAEEPGPRARTVDDGGLDRIAAAFAEIIDAKSPFTFRHSSNVAELGRGTALAMGLGETEARRIHRAGMLHDVGKLGISSRILDKPGPMTAEERREMERHPVYSRDILAPVEAFADFAGPAVLHHEKLDGSGYPWRLTGERLEPAARILAVADIYEALTADRPYRAGMPPERALAIVREEAGTRLCPRAVEGLEAYLER
jgi:HD-GYP domain-containing protein (c-di-GMP phosphodiesterase class II)